MFLLRRLAAVLLAAPIVVPAAHAWGPEGHRIVAELAQRELSPAAEAQVERLLAPEHTRQLADVANWADELRNDPEQQALWKRTRGLHYINFRDPHCHYVPPRDCPRDRCVVAALAHYAAVLGDPGRSAAQRREALKFVVHLVGDVHQPLHAGYRDDKGGNTYQVQFEGKGSNLHRVWDSGMLQTRGLASHAYVRELEARGPAAPPSPTTDPFVDRYAQWAEESCRATAMPGFYPAGHVIGQRYVAAELPQAERRLREAGQRLARLLNRTLDR
jgi:hypothetical protein